MKKLILLAVVIGFLVNVNVWADSFSIGPERWFLNGKEVVKGTPGAISGEILARKNLCVKEDNYSGIYTMRHWWHRGYGYRGYGHSRSFGGHRGGRR